METFLLKVFDLCTVIQLVSGIALIQDMSFKLRNKARALQFNLRFGIRR